MLVERLGRGPVSRRQTWNGRIFIFPDANPSVLDIPDEFAYKLIQNPAYRKFGSDSNSLSSFTNDELMGELKRRGLMGTKRPYKRRKKV